MICDEFNKQYNNYNCTTIHNGTKDIICKEKNSKFRISNKSSKKYYEIKIDDCLIKEGKKCDFLLINCDDNILYFVELKGSDLGKAVDQIRETIEKLKRDAFFVKSKAINAWIVLTKVKPPNLKMTKLTKLKRFIESKKGKLVLKTGTGQLRS